MTDQQEPAFKKLKKDSEVKLNDLPLLPFEKIFAYLSLENLIRSRAVCRKWHKLIDSFRVNSLCCSDLSSDFIYGNSRWVSGAFAHNFVSFTRFSPFARAFATTILSNLKHLRLCDLNPNCRESNISTFIKTLNSFLNSFVQLEALDLVRVSEPYGFECDYKLDLNLPMLTSLKLQHLNGIKKITLDAPRLRDVKIGLRVFHLRLDLVHAESVEKLVTWRLKHTDVEKLKNLKQLYIETRREETDLTFLSGLDQLKELHLSDHFHIQQIFERRQQYGHFDLKIYLCGLLLNGLEDPAIQSFRDPCGCLYKKAFVFLAENPPRLADEIPFLSILYYPEGVATDLAINIANRLVDLKELMLSRPVQDIESFLDFLKSTSIPHLYSECDQPQALLDRLPESSALQELHIPNKDLNIEFLLKMKNLMKIRLEVTIPIELIRKIFEELKFLLSLCFCYNRKSATIEIIDCGNPYYVRLVRNDDRRQTECFKELDEAINGVDWLSCFTDDESEDEEDSD